MCCEEHCWNFSIFKNVPLCNNVGSYNLHIVLVY
jgi:hypothetical protein